MAKTNTQKEKETQKADAEKDIISELKNTADEVTAKVKLQLKKLKPGDIDKGKYVTNEDGNVVKTSEYIMKRFGCRSPGIIKAKINRENYEEIMEELFENMTKKRIKYNKDDVARIRKVWTGIVVQKELK